jgi:phosphoribosylaminoimidazolecarboxamide formyltransferase / IMP cyclohydrolase
MKIRRALLSVFDKTNLKELACFLAENHVELISTGGTACFLREHHLPVIEVSAITGFPEIMDGRVKTLHPGIHAGLLAKRDNEQHIKALEQQGILPIDLVVINFYPFEKVVENPLSTRKSLIENIDIGGPAILRSSAKNHEHVFVLSEPGDYDSFMFDFFSSEEKQKDRREQLAIKAFAKTSLYDQAIAQALNNSISFPIPTFIKEQTLRYGENPHQNALVLTHKFDAIQLGGTKPIQGKALSYNNLLDADAAIFSLRCLLDGADENYAGAVIIKHGTPCGAAASRTILSALKKSIASDPVSAFGGIVALSQEVDVATADILISLFLEVIIAPKFTEEAQLILARKKKLCLLELENLMRGSLPRKTFRSINGGFLMQEHDLPYTNNITKAKVVTKRAPTNREWQDLNLAFRLCIPCRSNAITLAGQNQLLSVGAGQTSRIDAIQIAIQKAHARGHSLKNSSLGSDAFFPFADSIALAAEASISAIAQPGGSKRDDEVIDAANKYGLTMIFTGERHFRH